MVCQSDGFLLRTVRKNGQIRPPAYGESPGYSDTTMRHLRPTSARRMGRKAGAGCILSESLVRTGTEWNPPTTTTTTTNQSAEPPGSVVHCIRNALGAFLKKRGGKIV